jgi:CBS domain-containing protein
VSLGDAPALRRLDAFPYLNRVGAVMSRPLRTIEGGKTLGEAAGLLAEHRVSSLVILDAAGRAAGIVTERDLTLAVAADGAAALSRPVDTVMSSPVATVRADQFVHVAIGRLDRLGHRHLVVVDEAGSALGMVTARALLRQRAASALALGDEIEVADDASGLAAARRGVTSLVAALLEEGIAAPEIAEVISAVLCELARRATELAAAAMAAAGRGPAPAPWALLVLGSGGRGESLLAADQDNALVHLGAAADDPWFAELGRRVADLLDAAGIPYCTGGVMAREPAWRHSLAEWDRVVAGWAAAASPRDVLAADIFFDFRFVAGDPDLAERLRSASVARAKASPMLLHHLAADLTSVRAPVGLFGRLRARDGRIDLKLPGLFPIVASARVLALSAGSDAVGTRARLRLAAERGRISPVDADRLEEARLLIMTLILGQQTRDIAAGRPPGNAVEIAGLDRRQRRRLAGLLGDVQAFAHMAAGSLP